MQCKHVPGPFVLITNITVRERVDAGDFIFFAQVDAFFAVCSRATSTYLAGDPRATQGALFCCVVAGPLLAEVSFPVHEI